MKKALALLLSAMLLLGALPVLAGEEEAEGLQQDLVILFTSDVHCGVNQNFGLASLGQIRQAYEDAGNYTLLVDDGDFIQGEPLGTMTEGEALTYLMNVAGYDIAIPGNHEFDYGMDVFLDLAEKADFPYVSCNFNKEGELVFDPYVIKEFDGVKFAFVGICTPYTLTSSTPKYFQDESGKFVYGFFQDDTGELLISKVQEAVDAARAEGADYVIAMCHLGNEDACRPYTYEDIITKTNGIDLLLDGHSHDTDQVTVKNKDGEEVLRSACGTKLACIGTATIAKDGTISSNLLSWTLPMDAPAVFPIDNPVSAAIKDATEDLDELLAEVVGETDFELTINDPVVKDDSGQPIRIVRRAETNLGDLCADAVRYAGNADIAILNGGGIRVSIPAGPITRNNILTVHPFGNSVCVIEATGQQILDALEWGARAIPSETGGFLQVSGLTYEIHTYIDSPCTQDEDGIWTGADGEYRVKNVMVGDEPLDPEKTYRLAGTNYILLDQGDGYNMFGDADVLEIEMALDNQALLNYIVDVLGGVIGEEYADPYGQGRIIAVEEKPDQTQDVTQAASEEASEDSSQPDAEAPAESETAGEPVTEAAAEEAEAQTEAEIETEAAQPESEASAPEKEPAEEDTDSADSEEASESEAEAEEGTEETGSGGGFNFSNIPSIDEQVIATVGE